jgi:peroxisomal 2,4-dienoyl-CoA reductase
MEYKTFDKNLLKGRVAVITGGSRGGMLKEIARAYLIHGAKAVALISRNKEKNDQVAKELSEFGDCFSVPGDVRKPESVEACIATIMDKYG